MKFIMLYYKLSPAIERIEIYIFSFTLQVLGDVKPAAVFLRFTSLTNLYYQKCNIIKVFLFLPIFAFALKTAVYLRMCVSNSELEKNNVAMNFQEKCIQLKMAFHYIKPHIAKKVMCTIHKTSKTLQLRRKSFVASTNSDEANIFHVAVRFIIFHKISISFTFVVLRIGLFKYFVRLFYYCRVNNE